MRPRNGRDRWINAGCLGVFVALIVAFLWMIAATHRRYERECRARGGRVIPEMTCVRADAVLP